MILITAGEPEFKLVDHGVTHWQAHRGASVAYTKWTKCFTGSGMSEGEALEDAFAVAEGVIGSTRFEGLTQEYLDAVRRQPLVVDMLGQTAIDDEIIAAIDSEAGDLYHYVTLFVMFDKKVSV